MLLKSVLVLLCCAPCFSLRILAIFPQHSKSHFDAFEKLVKSLVTRGHEVVVVSHFPQQDPLPGYRDIGLQNDGVYLGVIELDQLPRTHLKYFQTVHFLHMMAKDSCDLLKTGRMKDLVRSDEKFDLILIEMFISDCFMGFVHTFKAPFIGLSSSVLVPWVAEHFGMPLHLSYIPSIFVPFSDSMNIFQRTINTLTHLYSTYYYNSWVLKSTLEGYKEIFGEDAPHPDEISRNASLLLVNTHFTLNLPRPSVPNVIEVGGMFLANATKKLPEHIEKWINESAHGVIYFSMGSMIKGHSFPPETRRAFLKAFSKLPQRVLWKWENESIPDQPSNVMIQKWMPQYDILCHPNVKAYISHGGLLGTTEAVWCGVPMVVMPQYGDQFANAAALQASGGGIILNFNEVTEETVTNTLRTILAPSFNKQAQKLSAAFKDRPMPPLETAIYWVEYVARHGGAHFMRTKAVGMPWYQYLLLDVIAFLLAVFLVIMAVLYYSLKMFFRLFATKGEKIKTN